MKLVTVSDPIFTSIGGFQGSAISASLLLLLLSDIELFVDGNTITSYSDDNCITKADKTLEGVLQKITKEAEELIRYFRLQKLSVHPDKSELCIISPGRRRGKKDATITVANKNISERTHFKILGVRFTNAITFEKHVEELIKKINQRLGCLWRLSYKVHSSAIKAVVEACITSKIMYAGMIFLTPEFEMLKKNNSHLEMAKVLNCAARMITRKKRIDKLSSKCLMKMLAPFLSFLS